MSDSNIGTTQQFVATVPASNINLAVNAPCDYCQANPSLATTQFVNGFSTANQRTLMSFPYSSSGIGATGCPTTVADNYTVGSAWGVAYARQSKKLYTATFLKRHVGLVEGLGNSLGNIWVTS